MAAMTTTATWTDSATRTAPASPVHEPAPALAGSAAERLLLLVAPTNGRFAPTLTAGSAPAGAVIAHINGGRGRQTEVRTPVAVEVRGLLLRAGQLVTSGQALAWAVVAEDLPA